MKVALVLSGQLRSFLEPPSLLDGIRQEGIVIDVFAHIPTEEASLLLEFWKTDRPGFKLRAMQAHDVRTLPEPPYKGDGPLCANRPWYTVSMRQSVIRHIAASYAAGRLVRSAEKQDRSRYDWIIKGRYDLKFDRPMEQLATLNRGLYVPAHDNWSGCNDKFAFGTSKKMERYMRLYERLHDQAISGMLFHPESALGNHLKSTGLWESVNRTRAIVHVFRYGEHDSVNWHQNHGDFPEMRT